MFKLPRRGTRAFSEAAPGTNLDCRMAVWRGWEFSRKNPGSKERAIRYSSNFRTEPSRELLTQPSAKLYFGRADLRRLPKPRSFAS